MNTPTVVFFDVKINQVPRPVGVGGVITPVNELAILAPYLALIRILAMVSAVYLAKRGRH